MRELPSKKSDKVLMVSELNTLSSPQLRGNKKCAPVTDNQKYKNIFERFNILPLPQFIRIKTRN